MNHSASCQLIVNIPARWTDQHIAQLVSALEQHADDVEVHDSVLSGTVEIDLHDDPLTAGMQLARHFDNIAEELRPYGIYDSGFAFTPCGNSPWPADTTLV